MRRKPFSPEFPKIASDDPRAEAILTDMETAVEEAVFTARLRLRVLDREMRAKPQVIPT